jgi:hypothetical protein
MARPYSWPTSSPWMRRYPQAELSRAICSTSARWVRSAEPSRTSAVRVHPAPPDQVGVPPKKGSRGDDQAQLARGQQPCQRGQERPVSPGQPRRSSLALENGDLVAQDKDLGLFGTA